MLKVSVNHTLKDLSKNLTRLQRTQLPYANAQALTQTAWNARVFAQDGMVRDLSKVKPFTLNAFKIDKATKVNQQSAISLKPIQSQYLGWAIEGGTKTAPNIAVPYNRKRMTKTAYRKWVARTDTFIGTIKGIRGLWQRIGRYRVKLIFAHETSVDYKPNEWRYYDDVARAVKLRFPFHWNKAMQRAIDTMR